MGNNERIKAKTFSTIQFIRNLKKEICFRLAMVFHIGAQKWELKNHR
jgi:hypothetical protein